MNENISVSFHVHIGDSTFYVDQQKLERNKHAASEIADKLKNGKHSVVDAKVSKVTKDLLKRGEFFLHNATGISKKLVKALLTEMLPGVALQVVRIAPAVLGIIL